MMADQQIVSKIMELRSQGLADAMIIDELERQRFPAQQVQQALQQVDSQISSGTMVGVDRDFGGDYGTAAPPSYGRPSNGSMMARSSGPSPAVNPDAMYDRMEQIAENLIDQKWDELIAEVQKIIEWKHKVEEKQMSLEKDIQLLKENFNTLHQGVLGKLDEYDTRMRDVGTELKAVGKVFKDVVPVFVENVKELGHITKEVKRGKGE